MLYSGRASQIFAHWAVQTDNVSQDLTFDEQFSSDPKRTTVKHLQIIPQMKTDPFLCQVHYEVAVGTAAPENGIIFILLKFSENA